MKVVASLLAWLSFLPLFPFSIADPSDTITLLNFKRAVRDPNGTLKGWNVSTDTCKWDGVSCFRKKVTGLAVENITLPSFVLAATIQNLTMLESLKVSGSKFTDSMEDFVLTSCPLKVLNISQNQLHGGLPNDIFTECRHLKRLILSHNQINGTLSSHVFGGGCKNLQFLDLSHNSLTGNIPVEMLVNCALQELFLDYNMFSGDFPVLNSSNKIIKLKLRGNSFSAFQIQSKDACKALNELDISSNNVSGKIFGLKVICPLLKRLNISENSFSGSLTDAFSHEGLDKSFLPSLELFDASFNKFSGEVITIHENVIFLNLSSNMFHNISKDFCFSSLNSAPFKLKSLLLPNNKLTGEVLNSVLDCGSLEMLDLSFNDLTEEIPSTICDKLPHLKHFLIWMNKLHGSIPSGLGDCTNLTTIILSNNRIQGIIPAEISQLRSLSWLSLSSNNLTGTIPPSLGELKNLGILQLSNNSLEGEIPLELSNCTGLRMLDLSKNKLSGKLPPSIGASGPIIYQVPIISSILGNCILVEVRYTPTCSGQVSVLELQGMKLHHLTQRFTDMVPECIWHLLPFSSTFLAEFITTSSVVLTLSHNNFSGEIPSSFGHNMQSLLMLGISHNFFTGSIPTSFGSMKAIQVLDLSYNTLSGQIPDSLIQLTFLYAFNVSYNNLSGQIPGGQLNTFDSSSYAGNPGLIFKIPFIPYKNFTTMPATESSHEDAYKEEFQVGVPFFIVSFLIASAFTIFHMPGFL